MDRQTAERIWEAERRRRVIPSDPESYCPDCGTPRRPWKCHDCGRTAELIDCGHYPQPRPIASGRWDGSELDRDYCVDCA
jgi:hypothetical protein